MNSQFIEGILEINTRSFFRYEENDNKKRVVLYNRKKGERSAVTEHTAESPKNDD